MIGSTFIRLRNRLVRGGKFQQMDHLAALISEEDKPFPWAVDQEKYNAMVQLLAHAGGPTPALKSGLSWMMSGSSSRPIHN